MSRPSRDRSRYFSLLLRLYPRSHRARYGEEMEAFFRRERESSGGGLRFWLNLTVDHLEAAWALRARRNRNRDEEGMMRIWIDDLWAAARSLRRAPRFTFFAVGTLALGVGAVTAVFTVVDRVLLRPLPYPDAERLVLVGIDPRHDPGSLGPLSPALLEAFSNTDGPAEAVAAARTREVVLRGQGDPERVDVTEVSSELLPLLGARATVGRLLAPSDHRVGSDDVVVLGYATWRERFGADPSIVGRSIQFDDRLYTVAGVLAEEVLPPPEVVEADAFWVPLRVDPTITGSFFLAGIAKLRPDATLEQLDAHADATVLSTYASAERPDFLLGASVRPYHEAVVGHVGSDLTRVLGGVGLLLLIACVNVAGLLLTRGAERYRELGVHFALGAPRMRIVRRLLSESVLLACLGAVVAAALAYGSVELFRAAAPAGLPRLQEVAVDGRSFAFALLVAGVTALVFGLLPALRSTRRVAGAIQGSRSSTLGRGEARLRGSLVVAETSLAVVMAVGSALLARDLVRVVQEDPGFRPDGLVSMTLNLEPRFGREEWVATWERLVDEARTLPGALAVSVATQAPWDGSRMASTYRPEGWQGEQAVFATTVGVTGDYVQALGARLLEGRALTAGDEDGEPVVVVNESFVRTYWPGESGVGKVVASGEEDEPVYRVVGVVADVRTRPGRDVFPHVYLPLSQAAWREMEVLVRTEGDAAALAPGLREVVRRIDPELPVTSIRTMQALSSRALQAPRFYAGLFGGFSVIALLLAVVGVYGTTAYATRARLREAGIRLVLGARREQVVRHLVSTSGVAVAVGITLGLGGAALASRVLVDRLVYIGPRDVGTYLLVGSVVAVAGLLAAWVPAGAAGRADPMETLREE